MSLYTARARGAGGRPGSAATRCSTETSWPTARPKPLTRSAAFFAGFPRRPTSRGRVTTIRGDSSTFHRPDAGCRRRFTAAAVEFDRALEDLLQRGLELEKLGRARSARRQSWSGPSSRARHATRWQALDTMHNEAGQNGIEDSSRQAMTRTHAEMQPGLVECRDSPACNGSRHAGDPQRGGGGRSVRFFGRKNGAEQSASN